MILSFSGAETEALFQSRNVRRFKNIEKVARRKLQQLNSAGELNTLRIPPGNKLKHSVASQRPAQHSNQRPMAHLLQLAG
jgi:proteic killer suppression protein